MVTIIAHSNTLEVVQQRSLAALVPPRRDPRLQKAQPNALTHINCMGVMHAMWHLNKLGKELAQHGAGRPVHAATRHPRHDARACQS